MMKGLHKGKLALAILASPKKGKEDDDETGDGREVAAGNILDAIKAKDPAGLASALSEFVDMCGE